MNTQDYLRSGKTLEDLNTELGINVTKHDTLPLVILNYDQINSPKTHPIVRECRGLTLNTTDYSLVARSFSRFYNWGEVADEMTLFLWDKAVATEKVDGSLCILYQFDGEWRINTRGSFGNGKMMNDYVADYHKMPRDLTWQQAFQYVLKDYQNLDKSLTYVVEFCSLWNKVVREYPEPCMYLLTCFAGEEEVGQRHPKNSPFKVLQHYKLNSAQAVQQYVSEHPEATFEGCVVYDGVNRWKIKNPRYVALHHLKGNDNLFLPKYALPFILKGETDELVTYYPEAKDLLYGYKDKVDGAYKELEALWQQNHMIEGQKEFALSIAGKKFTSVLFAIRKKYGKNQTAKNLKDEFNNPDMLLKHLF